MAIYKFTHLEDEWIQTNILGRTFDSEWLSINIQGKITVKGSYKEGYSWDGCSPKWKIFGKIIGTPDGRIDINTNLPKTYYASMIHDAIYQYKNVKGMCLSRKETDRIFKITLKKGKFKSWKLYNLGVRIGGWLYGKWQKKSTQAVIKVIHFSWEEG